MKKPEFLLGCHPAEVMAEVVLLNTEINMSYAEKLRFQRPCASLPTTFTTVRTTEHSRGNDRTHGALTNYAEKLHSFTADSV